jgi:hypothetical protein
MTPKTRMVDFSGDLLRRGFWLYVWEVRSPNGVALYYVGRTGDSSSFNAQSPFNRLSQHLGSNKNTNQVRRHLEDLAVQPEQCSFRLVAHGPILAEGSKESYRESRDVVAALEKELADAMGDSGYKVVNRVNCRMTVDRKKFARVQAAFAEHFPALQNRVAKAKSVR